MELMESLNKLSAAEPKSLAFSSCRFNQTFLTIRAARRFYEKHGFEAASQTKHAHGSVERMYSKPLSLAP